MDLDPWDWIVLLKPRIIALFAFLILALSRGLPGEAAPDFRLERALLARMARVLEKCGQEEEARDLRGILKDLGPVPPPGEDVDLPEIDGLRAVRSVARTVKSVAWKMGAALKTLDPEAQARVAGAVFRLDSRQRDALEVLDGRYEQGAWACCGNERLEEALKKARTLPVEMKCGPPPRTDFFKGQDKLLTVQCRDVKLHTDLQRNRAEKIFRQVFRAAALCSHLRGERLEVPSRMGVYGGHAVVAFTTKSFNRALDSAADVGWITRQEAVEKRRASGHWINRYLVARFIDGEFIQGPEQCCFGGLLIFLSWSWQGVGESWSVQPYLAAGLMNWICINFNRSLLPTVSWKHTPKGLARGGMAGVHRHVLSWVAAGKAPPIADGLERTIHSVEEASLLKATLVVDYLLARGDFPRLLITTRFPSKGGNHLYYMKRGLGEALKSFEAGWRGWMKKRNLGLAQRLETIAESTG